MAREDLLARTFVELADAWVDDFDLAKLSEMVSRRCMALFATSAGILLCDADGHLRISASSSDRMQRAQLYQLKVGEGPCLDCFRTGEPVSNPDLARSRPSWPRFTPVGLAAGFRSVHAVPVRSRDHVVGSINLFGSETGSLSHADLLASQALAHATALTILRQRRPEGTGSGPDPARPAPREDQFVVEQAKGVLAGRAGIPIDEARRRIERYAHHHNLDLLAVCRDVVAGNLTLVTFPETRGQGRRRTV